MEYNSTTTLNRIREGSPESGRACSWGWAKLLKNVGKTSGDDEPIDLLTILDSNGFNDALWVLSYAMPDDRLARHFQAWCADQVVHLTGHDPAVVAQIAMLRNDRAKDIDRSAARDAAWAAARAADGDAARAAARAAAGGAARAAAWAAAWDAQESKLRELLAQ